MPIFLFKSILGVLFFVTACVSLVTMLIMMGKADNKASLKTLRIIHKVSGFIFLLLLLGISYICLKYWAMAGDQISVRATMHSILALTLLAVFLIKISIAQFFKQLLKLMPAMGITVFTLVFVVTATSAGYYFLKMTSSGSPTQEMAEQTMETIVPDVKKGQEIYQMKCEACHYSDREEFKSGPGLKGLFQKEFLPSSRKPATLENVKSQLSTPFLAMPSFKDLNQQDLTNLLEYLKTF
jgi:hypothetical protein